jgi:hypothetical protein
MSSSAVATPGAACGIGLFGIDRQVASSTVAAEISRMESSAIYCPVQTISQPAGL